MICVYCYLGTFKQARTSLLVGSQSVESLALALAGSALAKLQFIYGVMIAKNLLNRWSQKDKV